MTVHQEKQGLLSPWLRRRRHARILAFIEPGDRVVDLACGSALLSESLPAGCAYTGVDRLPPPGRLPAHARFLQADLTQPGVFASIRNQLDAPAQVVVLAAFLEHVKEPAAILEPAASLLAPGGRIVGTTPAPRGRGLHDVLARIGICSRDGAEEHETFLDRRALEDAALQAGLRLRAHQFFLAGLNQVFVMESSEVPPPDGFRNTPAT